MSSHMKDESNRGFCASYLKWYRGLSRGKKIIYIVFLIWAAQAIPKWTVAIVGDGEVASSIMRWFVTPRGELSR
jgi:hypothetical protein